MNWSGAHAIMVKKWCKRRTHGLPQGFSLKAYRADVRSVHTPFYLEEGRNAKHQ